MSNEESRVEELIANAAVAASRVQELITKAANAEKSEDAMRFSQAANNAVNALATLYQMKFLAQ